MHIERSTRTSDQIEYSLIYSSIALTLLLINRFFPITTYLPVCPFHAMTGVPCPTCGVSRSISGLSAGDIVTAVAMNPLFCFSLLVLLCVAFYHLVTLLMNSPRIRLRVSEQDALFVRTGVVALLVINWAYLILSM